jgi:hypothetical protein
LKKRGLLFLFLFLCRRGATRVEVGSANGNSMVFFTYSCSFVGVVLREKKLVAPMEKAGSSFLILVPL